ncbi:MAG: DNA polymerase III subunit gamma/tau [Flavobacteriales bacterium]|nr:DNA polymerase III subunit gamma/tau [Flavobacteriales bacterium]
MDNFIVSARKYRPRTFDSVIGQTSITNTLKNSIRNNHLAQAFLFCGPRGVGKTTCARILAKTINCDNKTENLEACDKCESCTSFNQSHSFNIHELDAASHNSVDDIRNLIEQVRIAPQVGNYSIYIIDEVHMLSVSAFNAFLKTLEEPPSYAVFILATTSKQKIIPTILSRCQIFDFSRIMVEDIALHLGSIAAEQGVDAEPDGLHIIAQKADGSLRDALSIFDQMVSFGGQEISYNDVIENLNILDYDYYFKAINAILERNISDSLLLFDEVLNNGFDGHNYITGLSEHVRNLLVCKDEATLGLLQVGERIKKRYLEQSQACTASMLLDALAMANKCDIAYNTSINKRLHVELLLMQLCSVEGIVADEAPKVKIIPPPEDSNVVKAKPENTVEKVEEPKPEYKTDGSSDESTNESAETSTEAKEEAIAEEEASAEGEETKPDVKEENVKAEVDTEDSAPEQEKKADVGEEAVKEVVAEENESKEESDGTDGTPEVTTEPVAKLVGKPTEVVPARTDAQLSGEESNEASQEYKMQTKSLKDFAADSGETEKKNDSEPEELYAGTEITQELFDEVWGRYAEKVKDLGKHSLYSTMTKRKPVLGEDNIVALELDNSVQEAELNEEGAALHEFLRKELDNGSIHLVVNVIKTNEERKPYTSMEKFKRMAEENPSIEKFRKQLNLDID